ncbi:MAG: GGDEF domain-containing protein, partial [Bythopirellula sp.]
AIRSSKRTMDLAARYGGDEFVIIYPACDLAQAATTIDRLRTRIAAKRILVEDTEVSIQVSIGVAEATNDDTVDSLISRADQALYAAKRAGRNQSFQHNGTTCELVETTAAELPADNIPPRPIVNLSNQN